MLLKVARGFLRRQWTGNAVVYSDENDNVQVRYCAFESFVDCLDPLLHLDSLSQQALVSTQSKLTSSNSYLSLCCLRLTCFSDRLAICFGVLDATARHTTVTSSAPNKLRSTF